MPGTETIRSFVAVELPDPVLSLLGSTQERVRSLLGRSAQSVRWVKPEGVHLTLQFLGDVPVDLLPAMEQALATACKGARGTEVDVGGLGVFPNLRRPRVVWVGLEGKLEPLHTVQSAIAENLRPLGFEPDKPFSPHLTLGRVRSEAGPQDHAAIARAITEFEGHSSPHRTFRVHGVSLMQSDLRPTGAVYTRLAYYPLA